MKKKIGNSRLLFVRQKAENADLNGAIGLIDSFILSSRQVELVREVIFVYPEEDKKEEEKAGAIRVGREVSGYPTELPEGVEMADYDATEVREETSPKADNISRLLENSRSRSLEINGRLLRILFDVEHFEAPLLQFVVEGRA